MSSQADRLGPRDLAAPVVAATIVLATAAAGGGVLPTVWGWSALALALVTVGALLLFDSFELTRLELLAIGGLAGYAAWAGLSAAWSTSGQRSISELQRDLVYVVAAAAILLLARRRSTELLTAAVLAAAAAVTVWGLTLQLFPDRFGLDVSTPTFRLGRPFGYPGAVGITAAMAVLIAVGLAASQRPFRSAGAALAPLLVTAIYLTLSRSAWIALATGIVPLIALSPQRQRTITVLAALAVPSAAALWFAAHSDDLFGVNPQLATATRSGHRLALALLVLVPVSAALAAAATRFAGRWTPPRLSADRLAAAGVVVAASGVAAIAVFAGPIYDALRSPPPPGQGRLISASSAGRLDYWRVAWHGVELHPLLGSGAGTYELLWYRERPNPYGVRDAHTLYLEALAEVGPVGLGLLLVGLVPALLAARRVRTTFTAGVAGAYCAYLAHAAVDWDWEMPTVTLTAIACACVLLVHTRLDDAPTRMRPLARASAIAAAAAVFAFALVGYLGAAALDRSVQALRSHDLTAARANARRASRLEPWSPEPWRVLGDVDGVTGNLDAARANYSRMLAKDRNDWFAWYAVGLASHGSARVAAAHAGLRLNPKSPELASLLSR